MKVDEYLVICPKCSRPYGFIRCRVTFPGGKNLCLGCAVEEEKEQKNEHA